MPPGRGRLELPDRGPGRSSRPSTLGSPPGTPPWQARHLNEVHQVRPLDDPLGVFPPPDQTWLTANRAAFERLPARTRAVRQRVRFTLADATAMDYAVSVDGLDPLSAARRFMNEHSDDVRRWFG